ncbi:MAG TPA: M1 family metallopeptidase [Pedococcus sp.]|nr:M1 family metallopeptidase [Pedococcus sp.]
MSPQGRVVDSYVPRHGDLSFDALHYDVVLDYRVDGNHLSATTVVSAVAVESLDRVELDLHGLAVTKVLVDGARPARYIHRAGRLGIRLTAPVQPGQTFSILVAYQGTPTTIHGPQGEAGWEELHDGVIVAAQPHGAPSWLPCNDRPANKATYRFEVTTASPYHVTANGMLVGQQRRASRTTWVYEQTQPMATYLATLQIGRYQSRILATSPAPIAVVCSAAVAGRAEIALAHQAEMMRTFVRLFGPYPFDGYTVVITDDVLEIPLESQGLATFGSNFATTSWDHQRLVAHELSHQWFGNSLTLRAWRDIWLHEGFACYAEWLWSEESGGVSADQWARVHWERLSRLPHTIILADPTPEQMFDDIVYKRGALTLHALRLTLGDAVFFGLLRGWVQDNRHGSVTTGMFLAHAQAHAGRPLGTVLDPWLFGLALPALPPERPRSAGA